MEGAGNKFIFTVLFVLICMCSITAGNLFFHREGSSTTIDCSGDGDVQYWLLHGRGVAIDANSQDGIYMNANGSLHFDEVKTDHHGNHVCITSTQNTLEAFEVEMKVRPLPPTNMWEARYRKMFVTGLIAAIICLLFFLGIYLVDKYRWRDPEPRQKEHLVDEAYVNQAMEGDGIISVRM